MNAEQRAAALVALAKLASTNPDVAYVVTYIGVDTAAKLYL